MEMATRRQPSNEPAQQPVQVSDEMAALLGADSVHPNRDKLDAITQGAAQVLVIGARIRQLEEQLAAEQAALKTLQEQTLPSLMEEAQIPRIGIDEEYDLERQQQVFANITKANANKACAWLQKNGYGALVKANFKINVDKGDTRTQERIRSGLRKAKIPFEESVGVHAQTLGAFVRESLAQGRKLTPLIGVHCQPVAVLVKRKNAQPKLKRGTR
jgi:hypothetical protein